MKKRIVSFVLFMALVFVPSVLFLSGCDLGGAGSSYPALTDPACVYLDIALSYDNQIQDKIYFESYYKFKIEKQDDGTYKYYKKQRTRDMSQGNEYEEVGSFSLNDMVGVSDYVRVKEFYLHENGGNLTQKITDASLMQLVEELIDNEELNNYQRSIIVAPILEFKHLIYSDITKTTLIETVWSSRLDGDIGEENYELGDGLEKELYYDYQLITEEQEKSDATDNKDYHETIVHYYTKNLRNYYLYMKYKKNPNEDKKVRVTMDYKYGDTFNFSSIEFEDVCNSTGALTRLGYVTKTLGAETEIKYNNGATRDEQYFYFEVEYTLREYYIAYPESGDEFEYPGSGEKPANIVLKLGDVVPTFVTPNRKHSTFNGWFRGNDQVNIEGKAYAPGSTFMPSEDYANSFTLSAKFTDKKFNITFELNGGTMPEGTKTELTYYDDYYLPTPTLRPAVDSTRDVYTFSGWLVMEKLPDGDYLLKDDVLATYWRAYHLEKDYLLEARYTTRPDVLSNFVINTLTNREGNHNKEYIVGKFYITEPNAFGNAIVNVSNIGETIFIPAWYLGGRITTIAQNAFRDISEIYYVKMDEGIKHIFECAFYNMPNLTTVNWVGNMETIGAFAFNSCPKLKSINSKTDGVFNIGTGTQTYDYFAATYGQSQMHRYYCREIFGNNENFTTLKLTTAQSNMFLKYAYPEYENQTQNFMMISALYNCSNAKTIIINSDPTAPIGARVLTWRPMPDEIRNKCKDADGDIVESDFETAFLSVQSSYSGVTVYVEADLLDSYEADEYWSRLNVTFKTIDELTD